MTSIAQRVKLTERTGERWYNALKPFHEHFIDIPTRFAPAARTLPHRVGSPELSFSEFSDIEVEEVSSSSDDIAMDDESDHESTLVQSCDSSSCYGDEDWRDYAWFPEVPVTLTPKKEEHSIRK